jgi:mRNA interferase MazF
MSLSSFGEVVVLPFSYTDLQSEKRRPALVLLDSDDGDILVARITSKKNVSPFDIPIQSWREIGLIVPSFIRMHKLMTIEKNLIIKSLGYLSSSDLEQARTVFNNILA